MFKLKQLKYLFATFSVAMVTAVLLTDGSYACTTFSYNDGQRAYVAKNYDWNKEDGIIYVNKRGVSKHSLVVFPNDHQLGWKSKYGSVTFNQYGRELPNAGMNEVGLVVEVMQLDSSRFQQAGSEPSINESQWVQYMLDNASSVSELKKLAAKVRISKILVPLHYMACDQSGACVAVEVLNGRIQVSEQVGEGTKILTNDSYQDSLSYLKEFEGFGGHRSAPPGDGSLERFVRGAYFIKTASSFDDDANMAIGFDGLALVRTPITQWSIVYDIYGKKISFKSRSSTSLKVIKINAFDFDCVAPVLSFPVIVGGSGGDVSSQFIPYSHEQNAALVRRSLTGDVPETLIQAAVALPETTACEK